MARADKRPHDDLRQRQTQQVERISELAVDVGIDAHEAAVDPHPVYLTQAEADALYAGVALESTSYEVLLDGDGNPVFNGEGDWIYIEVTYG